MRVYLSSFRMGDRFAELAEAVGVGGRVAVISNAVDFIPDEARAAYTRNVFDTLSYFRDHGLRPHDLDLRRHFKGSDSLAEALAGVRLIWATGGNAFLLRRAMRQSGLDRIVAARLDAGDLIYGGWSAGAVVAGPSLRGLELMDDPDELVQGYEPEPVWEGLGLVDFTIVPHYRSEHPEADAAERVAARLRAERAPHRTLRDGEVIVA